MATKEDVVQALRGVMDPELGRDIVALGMVKDVQVQDGTARVKVELTTPACPLKAVIRRDVEAAARSVAGIDAVEVEMGAKVVGRTQEKGERLPNVANILAVGSGKGGVGKSTIAVNLALALAKSGARVGLLDADLYGPSIPIMLGLNGRMPDVVQDGDRDVMKPLEAHGLKVFSMGLLLKDQDAVIWRGPLLHKALTQFLDDVDWGELDYLVLDLPPGTGDVQISLANLVPITSAIVVTTPQDVAFADVLRAIRMFEVTKVPILGIVENMSAFVCPSCGATHPVFGAGRVRERTMERGLEYLGSVPLDPTVSPEADAGRPIVLAAPDGAPARAILDLAGTIAGRQSMLNLGTSQG